MADSLNTLAYSYADAYAPYAEISVEDWAFLKEFPDAASFSRAAMEVNQQLRRLQSEQEGVAKEVASSRARLEEMEKGLSTLLLNITDNTVGEVVRHIGVTSGAGSWVASMNGRHTWKPCIASCLPFMT